jgi:hypothetical protein
LFALGVELFVIRLVEIVEERFERHFIQHDL